MITSIDPKQLVEIFVNAEKSVTAKREILNNLNVYPVPDGDTGINMSLTLKEVVKNLDKEKASDLKKLAEIISESSLMGGRGNSGVILSQFLAGFCAAFQDKTKIDKNTLLKAFKQGTLEAYESVSNPVEGTILTIMKAATKEFEKQIEFQDLKKILGLVINRSQYILKQTPEMLDKLKEAGVVDAGGAGFIYFLEGFYEALLSDGERKVTATDDYSSPKLARIWEETAGIFGTGGFRSILEFNYKAIKFTLGNLWWLAKKAWEVIKVGKDVISIRKAIRLIGRLSKQLKLQNIKKSNLSILKLLQAWQETPEEKYCCEAILTDTKKSTSQIKQQISEFGGTSAIVAQKGKFTKIHFHSKDKKGAKKFFEGLGNIKNIKIDDLHKQHKEFISKKIETPKEEKSTKVVAVINGKGFEKIYKSFEGVLTLDGGKTMNPSLSDFEKLIQKLDSSNIIILPNNKNVFMVAEKVNVNNKKNIKFLKTYDQAQGLASLLNFNAYSNISENLEFLNSSLKLIKTFSITQSTRTTTISERKIKKGEFFAVNDKEVLAAGKSLEKVMIGAIKKILNKFQLITLYFGQNISREKAFFLKKHIATEFKCETQVYEGGQPHYQYIVSIE